MKNLKGEIADIPMQFYIHENHFDLRKNCNLDFVFNNSTSICYDSVGSL